MYVTRGHPWLAHGRWGLSGVARSNEIAQRSDGVDTERTFRKTYVVSTLLNAMQGVKSWRRLVSCCGELAIGVLSALLSEEEVRTLGERVGLQSA